MNNLLAVAATCITLVAGACSSSPGSTESGGSTTSSTTTTPNTTSVGVNSTDSRTSTSTTTAPPAGPECGANDWTMVDAGPFLFFVPADLVDQKAQGIDSLFGRFRGGGIELAFDYGWASPGLGEIERLGATIVPISLGGVDGAFGTADAAGTEYGSDFITHLVVESVPSADPSAALWLGVSYDQAALVGTAECIVSTVRFAGVTGPDDEEEAAGVTVEPAGAVGEHQIELAVGAVRLWVSNQSFQDDPVVVSVSLDGVAALEETLFVEGQHNWMAFDISGLGPGEHSLTATSSTGAEHSATFTLPEDERRWLVLDYWHNPGDVEGRFFSFDEYEHAVAFN